MARRQADQALVSDGAQLHGLHPSGFDPERVERVARAIAAGKRDPRTPPEEIDRVWTAYCGQARAALTADDSALAKENADLIHDLERQMSIANIECNLAEDRRELLEVALPYVDSMAEAHGMMSGFGEKRARQADVDARAIRIALGADLQPLEVNDLLRPALTEADFAASGTEAQRATTVKQGVVHDGPTRAAGDAQSPTP